MIGLSRLLQKIAAALSRQFSTIQKGGAPAVRRLAYRLAYALATTGLLPVSLLLFVLMRLVRTGLLIRLNPVVSSRLGHFACNTELYLCEKDAGINMPSQRYLDLSYYAGPLVSNAQLGKMWKRQLSVWPAWLLDPVYRLNRLVGGGGAHEVGHNSNSDRDIHNLLEKSGPHLQFTDEEEASGCAGLAKLGVPPGSRFICLIGRDNAYLQTVVTPGGNFDYHDFRDVDINNFVAAVDSLAERGYYVLRMGSVVLEPIKSANEKVIDYATSELRSDFLDVYLGAKCFFCISVGCGFDAIPIIFRRPVCYVNMLPVGYLFSFLKDSVAICKRHWDASAQRWITLAEVFSRGVGFSLESRDYLERNIKVMENTPEEIRDVVLEMLARLELSWEPKAGDAELQARFWEIFPIDALSPYNNKPLHSRINLKYGAQYLRENQAWLS